MFPANDWFKKLLSSVAIFRKIEDHFEQNQPDRLRENSRQKIGRQNWPQTGKFANCAPEIKISRKFCAPSFGNSAPGLQVCAGSFLIIIIINININNNNVNNSYKI